MPQKNKPKTKLAVEQKEYYTYNPQNIKQSVEIAVKPKPSLKDLETVGKPKKIKALKKVLETDDKSVKLNPKGYSLIITEKPQAAEKIAAALSDGRDRKMSKPGGVSYYELERNNKQIIVACAVGHLFTVSQSKKSSGYPVFDIEWVPNFEVKKADFTKKYFDVIKSLIKGASEIIIATDFDVEGEVID